MATQDKIGRTLLYLVRHATIDGDKANIIRGLLNEHLDETGEKEANELVDFFHDIRISAIYLDDFNRTLETALPIADDHSIEVKKDVRLRSWDAGTDLEGRSIEANAPRIKELKLQPWLVPVGGESWASFEEKILGAFYDYVGMAMSAADPILLTLHGSGLQVISADLGLIEKMPTYDHTPVEPAGVIAVSLARSGLKMKIIRGAKEDLDAS